MAVMLEVLQVVFLVDLLSGGAALLLEILLLPLRIALLVLRLVEATLPQEEGDYDA
jgi:hypothetical protein